MKIKNLNRSIIDAAVKDFAVSLTPAARTLDIGAGSGHYRQIFHAQNYLAIDRGYEQQSVSGLSVVADIAAIPFAAETMDAAICLEVLEHVTDPDLILREIFRVMRPGGTLMLSTPFCLGEHMKPYDFFRFTRFMLSNKLEKAGFDIVSIRPRGGFFTLLAYLLARFPDEIFRGVKGWTKIFKPLIRLVTTYSLARIVLWCDRFDAEKNFTLGYICLVKKP